MSKPSAATAYSRQQAEIYDERRFTSPSGHRVHQAELDLVFWMLGRVPRGGRVLEVGCGTGRILVEVLEAGYRIDGADASPDMMDMLRRKLDSSAAPEGGADVELTVSGAADLSLADDTYDAVYAVRLLNQTESTEYALRVIAEMIRVARPGGYVLAEFANHYRPKLGTAARKTTTRVRPADAIARGREAGGELVGVRGAFFLGMQAYGRAPRFLLGFVDTVDRLLSRLMPRLCSRTYVLFRKAARS